jgi:hypothetical protein
MYQSTLNNVTVMPHQSQVKAVQCLAVDAGNRFTKIACSNGFRLMFPSYWGEADYRASEKISYQAGDNPSLIGEWIIGENAKFCGCSPVFYSEKQDEAPYLIFGAIALSLSKYPVTHIQKLKICLPDSFNQSQNQKLIQTLKGTHQLSFDDSEFTVKISSVVIESEGVSAYKFLRKQGTFRYAKINGILDLGGGNGNATLFTPNGQPIWASRLVLPGTIELAKTISQSQGLLGVEAKGNSPRIEVILDAIESGSFCYGDRSFKSSFNAALKPWLKDIQNKMLTQWGEWLPELAEIAVIGGSNKLAELLVKATNGRVKIALNGQRSTVEGMLL